MSKLIDEYMGLAEAAEQLGIHKETLAAYAREKRVKSRKFGRKYLFKQEDLRSYVESLATEPKGRPGPKKPERAKIKHLRSTNG